MATKNTCMGCYRTFIAGRPTHRYCSRECQKLVAWEWREARMLDTGADDEAMRNHFNHRPNAMRKKKTYADPSLEGVYENASYDQTMRGLREERKRNGRCENIDLGELIERDNSTCYICGGKVSARRTAGKDGKWRIDPKYPTMDHVVPLSRDGEHVWDNVKLAHWECNRRKGGKLTT